MAWLFTVWVILTFVAVFLLLLPAYYVFLLNPKWNRMAHKITRLWGIIHFSIAGIRTKALWEFEPEPEKNYIYCPNHFSYVDIPIMARTLPGYYQFVGKRSLSKIPVFGYMYRKLYILVERESRIDSYRALQNCLDALDKKISIVIFPEGGILTPNPPQMTRLKDGAFRMAIEKKVPIVPVSIPFNWIFLQGSKLDPSVLPLKITYHKPIETREMNMGDLAELKERTRKIIQDSLDSEFQNEDRQGNSREVSPSGKIEA